MCYFRLDFRRYLMCTAMKMAREVPAINLNGRLIGSSKRNCIQNEQFIRFGRFLRIQSKSDDVVVDYNYVVSERWRRRPLIKIQNDFFCSNGRCVVHHTTLFMRVMVIYLSFMVE